MKSIKYILAVGAICLTSLIQAQQEQQYSQYMVNGFVINPGRTGIEDFIDVKLGYRKQWLGLEAAPRTAYLSGHSRLTHHGTKNRGRQLGTFHSAGVYIFEDKTGPLSKGGYNMSYAVNVPLNKEFRLSVGGFLGAKQYRIAQDWQPFQSVDSDELLRNEGLTKLVPDAALGGFLYSKYYYFGLSAFQILGQKVTTAIDGDGKLKSHLFFTGGMRIPFSSTFSAIPSFLIKMIAPTPISFDANLLFTNNDVFFYGINTRFSRTNIDGFAGVVGVTLMKQFDISYSYDLILSDLALYQTGSHEVIIGLRLKHPHHIDCPGRKWH